MMTLITAALALFAIAGAVWVNLEKDEVDEQRERLDRYSVSLHERADMLDRLEKDLKESRDGYEEIRSTYSVTGSDRMKYGTDKAVYNAARKHIAQNIAGDIVRMFEPEWDGDRMTYKFRIKK